MSRPEAPAFSVIVPCFNNERYLPQCLESLFAQTCPRNQYEVILVDNNSRDRSLEIARAFPDLIVLEETKQSSYAARNRGVRESRGQVLVFTDSDCEVSPAWIEEMGRALAEPAAGVALGSRRFGRESFLTSIAADYDARKVEYICTQPDKSLYFGYTNNMAVRREVFERCGPFLEIGRGADTIFVSRAVTAYGPASVRYAGKARIRHLEILSVWDWCRKLRIYGASYQGNRGRSGHSALRLRQRLEVMRRTVALDRHTALSALSLVPVLAIGGVGFELGRILESLRRRPPTPSPVPSPHDRPCTPCAGPR
jgi:glycosyltransferase involved in cell wall biosynthesis